MAAKRGAKTRAAAKETVAVLGLGYVGLPLAVLLAERGFSVVGLDRDEQRVRAVAHGRSPIRHVASVRVKQAIAGGAFEVSTDFSKLGAVTAAIICVPTPLTRQREPDLGDVEDAARQVARHGARGVLVVLQSTTYPGTTRGVVQPLLEAHGWKLGKDFDLAFSPEREDLNNSRYSTRNIPKLVGGMNQKSLTRAVKLFSAVVDTVVPVSSCEVAEAAKLLENIFRSVNIALVNELKVVFDRMGIDVWEVIEAAKSKPFGFMTFYPGPGLGGHCIPVDPFYLTWKAREFDLSTKFIELAGEVNTAMPHFVLEKVRLALNSRKTSIKGARILVLGVAYKKDVDDVRESPALKLIDELGQLGARVAYHDPYVPALRGRRLKSSVLSAKVVQGADLVLLITDHSGVDYRLVQQRARLIVDTRGKWRADQKRIFGA